MKTKDIKETKENMDLLSVQATDVNTDKVADEIIDWLITNVEQFIDNQSKIFKIDLVIDGESEPPMTETKKLQDFFRQIPEDEKLIDVSKVMRADGKIDMKKLNSKGLTQAAKIRSSLNDLAEQAFYSMQEKTEKLNKLFERMSFFYELIGINKGNPLLRQISGAVNITKFEYEAFSMDVQVKSPTFKIQQGDGGIKTIESSSRNYNIPEGFTVWVEIAFKPKMASNGLF